MSVFLDIASARCRHLFSGTVAKVDKLKCIRQLKQFCGNTRPGGPSKNGVQTGATASGQATTAAISALVKLICIALRDQEQDLDGSQDGDELQMADQALRMLHNLQLKTKIMAESHTSISPSLSPAPCKALSLAFPR